MWREVGAVQWVVGSAPSLPLVHGCAQSSILCMTLLSSLQGPTYPLQPLSPWCLGLIQWTLRPTAGQAWLGHNLWLTADGASSRAGPDRMREPKVTRLPSRHLPAKASPAGVKLIRRVCGESGASSRRAPSPAAAWFCHTDLCFLRPPSPLQPHGLGLHS